MATVKQAIMPDYVEQTRDFIDLRIEGMTEIEPGVFRLANVASIEPDWQRVETVLRDAGMPRMRAAQYTCEFADALAQKELARTIAERSTRVG